MNYKHSTTAYAHMTQQQLDAHKLLHTVTSPAFIATALTSTNEAGAAECFLNRPVAVEGNDQTIHSASMECATDICT